MPSRLRLVDAEVVGSVAGHRSGAILAGPNRLCAACSTPAASPPIDGPIAAAMQRVWATYDAEHDEIAALLRAGLADHPEFGPLVLATPPDPREDARTHGLLRAAMVSGEWESYWEHIRHQATGYANADISFRSWVELIHVLRIDVLARLVARPGSPAGRADRRPHRAAPLARRRAGRVRPGVRQRQRAGDPAPAAGHPPALDPGAAAARGPADPADGRGARRAAPGAAAGRAARGRAEPPRPRRRARRHRRARRSTRAWPTGSSARSRARG